MSLLIYQIDLKKPMKWLDCLDHFASFGSTTVLIERPVESSE